MITAEDTTLLDAGGLVLAEIENRTPDPHEDDRPTRTWPRTIAVSSLLTTAFFVALVVPLMAAEPKGIAVLACFGLAAVGVVIGRLSLDSRIVKDRGQVTPRALLALLPPTILAVGAVDGGALLVGERPTLLAALAGGAAVGLVLLMAEVMRAAEVRFFRASRRVVLVSSKQQARDVAREIGKRQNMELVGAIDTDMLGVRGLSVDRLASFFEGRNATTLVLSSTAAHFSEVVEAASRFNLCGGRVRDLSGFYERHFGKIPLEDLTPMWFLFDVAEIHRARPYGFVKRAAELLIAVVLLVLLSPVIVAVAVAIRAGGGGPILFRQQRVGLHGKRFEMLKFRTMRPVAGEGEGGWASQHRQRVTSVGQVLRRSRLDELPQLITVLRGDMSLVGPRPEQVGLVEKLSESIRFYDARHTVRPGLTGWAQINSGYSGSEAGTLVKLQYDFYYIRKQTLRLDLLILLRTFNAVVAGSGSD